MGIGIGERWKAMILIGKGTAFIVHIKDDTLRGWFTCIYGLRIAISFGRTYHFVPAGEDLFRKIIIKKGKPRIVT